MKLRPRLWLFGAILPVLALAAVILVAGELFRLSLVGSLDEAMRAQASVERVSLFDGPSGEPHLIERDDIGDAAEHPSIVAIYAASGEALVQFPHKAHAPDHIDWSPSAETDLRTSRDEHGHEVRELRMPVRSSNGLTYLLRLASPLASVEATLRTFYRTAVVIGGVITLLLFAMQAWQIQAAEQRAALAEAAKRVQRALDAQERLIANAAHELRTPLTIMRTQMDLALRRERTGDELRLALTESRAEVDRLAYLASHLLDLAAASRVARELRSGDLVEVVTESVTAYKAEASDAGLTLSLRAPAQATATFERTSLRQAIDNFLSNACKFSPRGGTIEVELVSSGEAWEIRVRDSGPGVTDEQREKIFEPFYRVTTGKPGAGLGLAIAREVARLHGGEAFAQGATFTLRLPA